MKNLLIAAAIAAATTASPVYAVSMSSVTLSDFTFTVSDLNELDGINPGYSSVFLINSASATVRQFPLIVEDSQSASGPGAFSVSASADNAGSFSNAQTTGNEGFVTRPFLLSSGQSLGFNNQYNGGASFSELYRLDPMTRLTITARSNLVASITSTGFLNGSESAVASTTFRASNVDNSEFNFNETVENQIETRSSSDPDAPLSISQLSFISIFFDNTSLSSMDFIFRADAQTSGFSLTGINETPSAVPVPAALPLMASALGIFGLARRRNKSKAA